MSDILQVITTTDRRGAELWALDLDRALTARGYAVRTVALAAGSQGHALSVPTLGPRRLGQATLRTLRSRARQARLVLAHGSTTLPACAIGLAGSGTPFVYRNIGDPAHWGATRGRRLRSAVFLHRARAVVALTDATAKELTRRYHVAPEKITVIPKAVATERFEPPSGADRLRARAHYGLAAGAPVALSLGALSPEKNVPLAIEAVASLPDVHLLVVGDGPERSRIEALGLRLAPGRVHVVGATDHPEVALAAADVVVISSETEGLPGTLIEAGLCALPTVTTDVGSVREIVEDTVTGLVVPAGDPAALAAALGRCLDAGADLGPAARSRCLERFSLENVSAIWADFVASILGSTA